MAKTMEPPRSERLTGANLLVVEDELMLLLELESVLSDAGADKVLLARSTGDALLRAREEPLSAAILDIRIGPEVVTPVARVLAKRGVPFLFYTGQPLSDPALAEWRASKVLTKPSRPDIIVQAVAELIAA
jgi:DNA-binding response OmpR family regulator